MYNGRTKKILLVVIVIGVILVIFNFLNKKETVAPSTNETKAKEFCFAMFGPMNDRNYYYDKYTLRLMVTSEKATGELNFLPGEKDSKVGKVEGTVSVVDKTTMVRTADLWWDTFGEGISAKEEIKITFGEGAASIGAGELIDRGDGVYVYKDPQNLFYTLTLPYISCTDLTLRENIEKYLRENISELSPVKAVLGGTWYVNSVIIDLAKNSGTVIYEDGHIQEKKDFSYTTDGKGSVASLIIK